MATIYANSTDGYIRNFVLGGTWSAVRDATSASKNDTATRWASSIYSGSLTFFLNTINNVTRAFFAFDTSGISSAPSAATLKLYGYGTFGTRADVWALKSDAFTDSGSLHNDDFNNITGWSTGSSDGSGAGDNESNVTKYSNMYDVSEDGWSASGYNDITLNSTALSDMASLDTLLICVMADRDLKDLHTGAGDITYNGTHFQNYTGTSRDPYIDYTPAVTATDNSVFFGCNF